MRMSLGSTTLYFSAMPTSRPPFVRFAHLVLFAAIWVPRTVAGQTGTPRPRESPTAPVALLPVALYTAQANLQDVERVHVCNPRICPYPASRRRRLHIRRAFERYLS